MYQCLNKSRCICCGSPFEEQLTWALEQVLHAVPVLALMHVRAFAAVPPARVHTGSGEW